MLDLIYSWGQRPKPVTDLMFILLDVIISFVLGLLPGLDNFSHIGGFMMGLVLGICILRSPNVLRERIGLSSTPYQPMMSGARTDMDEDDNGIKAFSKQPVGFFKGRKPAWWAWWLLRVGALVGVLVGFIVLLNNFYKYRTTCSWCKHLSCLVSHLERTREILTDLFAAYQELVLDWPDTGHIGADDKLSQLLKRC